MKKIFFNVNKLNDIYSHGVSLSTEAVKATVDVKMQKKNILVISSFSVVIFAL